MTTGFRKCLICCDVHSFFGKNQSTFVEARLFLFSHLQIVLILFLFSLPNSAFFLLLSTTLLCLKFSYFRLRIVLKLFLFLAFLSLIVLIKEKECKCVEKSVALNQDLRVSLGDCRRVYAAIYSTISQY